jgi:uncharacterized membrane protein
MQASKILLAVIMTAAGVYHFANPQIYVSIVPKYLPWHLALVYVSGFLEILFGVGLLTGFSSFAAWGLMALFVAVFPANLNMALHPELAPQIPSVLLWLRLPLQAVLIWWAWQFTKS